MVPMKKIPFSFKILLIFLIPAITLIYFSFSFVKLKYKELNESAMYSLSAEITDSLSKLIHNIQIERGLSAGYIVAKDNSKYKVQLLKQYEKTDAAYKAMIAYVKLKTEPKKMIVQRIGYVNKPLIKQVINEFGDIESTRRDVLNLSIDFEKEMNYYTTLNKQLMKSIKSFVVLVKEQSKDGYALSKLQMLKECAGQERAYIYNMLLSGKKPKNQIKKALELIKNQNIQKESFILNTSIESTLIYNHIMKKDIDKAIIIFREKFFHNELDSDDATRWFELATMRIDMFEKVSTMILQNYIDKSKKAHEEAIDSLYMTALLWSSFLVSMLILAYILRTLVKKEEFLIEELRISAYSFDSHEAMTITDLNGTILKVNDAFSRITGYLPSEVIGKNPRVLKSMKHSDEFYQNMWKDLHTKGRWSDEIYNKRKNGEIYLEHLSITAIKNEENITTHYIAQFLDISELKHAQEEAQHQADHDSLTGLLNRKALLQRLNEEFIKARRHDFLHAFLFIDLDEFKAVNDTFGHKVGDMLLVEVAKRLDAMLREEDILSRVSGDEFAILILNIDKSETEAAKDVENISKKIIHELSQPFVFDEYKVNISASIGLKLFPDGEKTAQDVVVHADTAMYQAKHQGKNQFVFFDKAIELELKHFQILEEELTQADKNDEFVFYFQPKVDIQTNKIVAAEALVRWNHPQKGLLYPGSFLDVVQSIGMIHKITLKALESVCQFLESHKDIFRGTISLNINSSELLHANFEEDIVSVIQRFDVEVSQIELEITENELIKDFDTAIIKIKKLKEFGLKFSIDDFGTGYSSITYLQKLPVDSLKIDKSFLQDISEESNREIVKMMLSMARTFNILSIVEGVENQTQLDFVKENGADMYQGFFCSQAVSEKNFIKLLG